MSEKKEIKAIIGLGNPGNQYRMNRHNIGFLVIDNLAEKFDASFKAKQIMEVAEIEVGENKILLIKPQTFMNDSGKVIPGLAKQGIKPENILVVHDELELPFGTIKYKFGGSAKGHNGLRSIIAACGDQFGRIRVGIARPEKKEHVPEYVLSNFTESKDVIAKMIEDTSYFILAMI